MKADAPVFEGNLALDTYLYEEGNKPVFTVIDGSKNTMASITIERPRNTPSLVRNRRIALLAIIATICVFIVLSSTLLLTASRLSSTPLMKVSHFGASRRLFMLILTISKMW